MPAPFDAVLNEALGSMYREITEIRAVLIEHGFLPGRTRSRIERLKSTYNLMCPTRDAAIEQALILIERALDAPPPPREDGREIAHDVAAILHALNALSDACRPAVVELARLLPAEWGAVIQDPY